MVMGMGMRAIRSEPEASVRRRARVLAWRLAQGELIVADFSDPAWDYVREGYRVPPGSASGVL